MKIAQDGIERFTRDKFDLIIVDTSGRHKQEASLFTEMLELAEVVVRSSNYNSTEGGPLFF